MLKPTKNIELRALVTSFFTYRITKGSDQTARMRRLVCAFFVRKQQSHGFQHRAPYYVKSPGFLASAWLRACL